ncbi:unnamed protein product [Cyprideis torosa]|uniref:Uncharacterized protein n=1 Tax=Cyprideis torosa TaxID=163714 RepID=A0A7R8WBP0_9CRUS|nr:unnamed protein product [Cyprideis torosa]CAG0892453.1 unnamed protein product [Cyprideis torosa]
MADDELEEIRKRRMAELQGAGGALGGKGDENEQERRREQQEVMKNSILSQVLDQEARARLSTLMLAKPDKGRRVEAILCQMASTGQIGGKLGEAEFRALLEKINTASSRDAGSSGKVKFQRRRIDSDDDE